MATQIKKFIIKNHEFNKSKQSSSNYGAGRGIKQREMETSNGDYGAESEIEIKQREVETSNGDYGAEVEIEIKQREIAKSN